MKPSVPSVPAVQIADMTPADFAERMAREAEPIINTMQQWLNGEPVWSYAQVLERWGGEFEMYRKNWNSIALNFTDSRGGLTRRTFLFEARQTCIQKFGFAIPCAELFEALRAHAPILEIGAGTGYMTAMARHAGVDIIGTDGFAGQRYGFIIAHHDAAQIRLAAKTAVRRRAWRRHSVFCSWPTYDHTWFRQALKAMRHGQRLIIVREDACADDSAWDYLAACFVREAEIDIPAWPGMNDLAEVWIKRRQIAPTSWRHIDVDGEDDEPC